MRRRLVVGGGAAVTAIVLSVVWCRREPMVDEPAAATGSNAVTAILPRGVDPRALPRASIAGVSVTTDETSRSFHMPATEADGRFEVEAASVGVVIVQIHLRPPRSAQAAIPRTIPVTATGTVDLGDIPVARTRLAADVRRGTLGIRFRRDERHVVHDEIERIEPASPAAQTELRVGDRVTRIDGVDVSNDRAYLLHALLGAPAGTAFKLEVARGIAATVVSAAGPDPNSFDSPGY